MEKLLKAKHWQIFLLLVLGLMIGNFSIENEPTISVLLTIIGMLLYMIYPLTVGHFLQDYVPRKIKLYHNLFLINSFLWFLTYSIIMILSDGQGMTFNGLIALPFFYVFYAFLHFIAFPAKTLKTIEKRNKVQFGDYISDFFLILFLPIGVWFLQPRINKIIESGQTANEKSRTANIL